MTSMRALAVGGRIGQYEWAPGVGPELAFRLRCYVAADFDPLWRTMHTEVPLAAFLTSVASGEQVAPAPGALFSQDLLP